MLFNKTSNKLILKQTRTAKTFFEKFKGLMFKKSFDYALIFDLGLESRVKASIHMLFVFTPIDVLFLNKNRRVVDLVQGLKPWTLNFTPKKPAYYIVELPASTIKEKGIKLNDVLEWS